MPEIRIELYDPENMSHRHGVHVLFDLQAREISSQIDAAFPKEDGKKARLVEGPVTQKVKREREAAQLIFDRAIRSKQSRKAFAHVAIRMNGKDPEVVGYILSHMVLENPIGRHTRALRARFRQLKGLDEEQFRRAVLSGEHSYVLPSYRGEGIGGQLFDWHEKEAARRGFKVRASHVGKENGYAKAFLSKRGYRVIAVRNGGIRIVAKPLAAV